MPAGRGKGAGAGRGDSACDSSCWDHPDSTGALSPLAISRSNPTRWNLRTGELRSIKPPEIDPENDRLRFNWNAGIVQDPFEPGTIYYGSQYVHKSIDRGESWTVINPDLTTDKPKWQSRNTGGITPDVTGAENYTTIIAISPSPLQKGAIWVGTDDGRVHVTRDGGKAWESGEKSLKGVPANTWVSHIRASKFDAASAFVVLDNHRRDDWKPYVFRTDDWGKTWKSLAAKDIEAYALSIEQDRSTATFSSWARSGASTSRTTPAGAG